jgi:hypothetical protein
MSKSPSLNQIVTKNNLKSEIQDHPPKSSGTVDENFAEGGEKTIKCWNCEAMMKVKEEWKVVQCPTCEKICKIPTNNIHYNLNNIKYNDNINHFDVNVPYVYILVMCPFCKTDNKLKVGLEHMICYRCHNSVNITPDKTNIQINNSNMRNDYYNNSNNHSKNQLNFNQPNANYPMRKSMRFSDLFFPDPMFYPGYYPTANSVSPLFPEYDPYAMAEYLDKKNKYNLFMYHIEKNKEKKKSQESSLMNRIREIKHELKLDSRHKDHLISVIKNSDYPQSDYKTIKNEIVYKSMFNGVIGQMPQTDYNKNL